MMGQQKAATPLVCLSPQLRRSARFGTSDMDRLGLLIDVFGLISKKNGALDNSVFLSF